MFSCNFVWLVDRKPSIRHRTIHETTLDLTNSFLLKLLYVKSHSQLQSPPDYRRAANRLRLSVLMTPEITLLVSTTMILQSRKSKTMKLKQAVSSVALFLSLAVGFLTNFTAQTQPITPTSQITISEKESIQWSWWAWESSSASVLFIQEQQQWRGEKWRHGYWLSFWS